MERVISPAGCVHALPGRLRVKVVAIKKAPALAAAAERALRQERGVVDAMANPVTGSILIRYDLERTSPQTILAHLARNGLSPTALEPNRLSEFSSEFGKTLGKELVKMILAEMLASGPMEVLFALL